MTHALSSLATDEGKSLLQGLQWIICLSKECSTLFLLQARHSYMMASNPYQEIRVTLTLNKLAMR